MKVTVSWFSVKDFEQAKKFYEKSLGLKKTFETEQWAEFAGGEGEASIGLAVNPPGQRTRRNGCLASSGYRERTKTPGVGWGFV